MKKRLSILIFVIVTMLCCSQSFSSNFDEYYEQWKKEHNITTEEPYQNLTDEQKKRYAQQDYENYEMNKEIKSLNKQIENKDKEIQELTNQRNIIIAIILGIVIIFVISASSIFIYRKICNKKGKK